MATIGDPTAQVADLFNAVYETTLQALSRYFVHSGETDDQVEVLARTAKHLMNQVGMPLGSILLTTLPLGPERPGVLAGPAFEIVQPSFYVLPHRQAAWRILAERLEELADRTERLSQTTGLEPLAALQSNCRAWPTTSKRPDNPPTPLRPRDCHLSTVEVVMASGPPPTSSSRSCSPPGCGASTGWWGTASTRWWTPSATTTASSGSMCATRRPARSQRGPRHS